ncbi:MAG: isoamylase early set domain-containing protein [Nitrospira sp.]
MLHRIALGIVLIALAGLWSCAQTIKQERLEPPKAVAGGVRFTVHVPGAKQVSLVGSFNGWSKGATPMNVRDGALWSIIIPLKAGEHTFMYLIDGSQWVTPPHAEDFVTDGFGQTNGVVIVR